MGSAPHYARSGRDQTVRRGLWGHRESRGPRWNRGARPSSHCWRIRLRNVYGLDQSHTADAVYRIVRFLRCWGESTSHKVAFLPQGQKEDDLTPAEELDGVPRAQQKQEDLRGFRCKAVLPQ